jgi:nitroreductase
MLAAAEYLAARIRTSDSSIYPAVQNMLLAGRALGLGATLPTLYLQFEKEAEAALGLPPNVHSYALLPIGYPWAGLDPSVVSLSPMLSMGTGGGQPCGL